MEQETITIFLKGGKEKEIPIDDIEIYFAEKLDEMESRYILPKFPRPEQLAVDDDSDLFPNPDK